MEFGGQSVTQDLAILMHKLPVTNSAMIVKVCVNSSVELSLTHFPSNFSTGVKYPCTLLYFCKLLGKMMTEPEHTTYIYLIAGSTHK